MEYNSSVVIAFVVVTFTFLILKKKFKWNYIFGYDRRYRLKWVASYLYLKYFCLKTKCLSRYNFKSLSPQQLALLPFNFEIDLEKPCNLIEHKEAFDSVAFCGTDDIGNLFYAKIVRHHDRHYATHFLLKLDGLGDYTFTQNPDTNFYNTDGRSFSCNGLCIEVLEPMRTWRISYNGWLRNSETTSAVKEVHVKIVFIWSAISLPFDFKTEMSDYLHADYLVQKGFIETLQSSAYDERFRQNRYEQWGQLAGIVKIEDLDEMNIYLRGLRAHSFGLWDWNEVDEIVDIQTYLQDGTAVHMGQVKHRRNHLYKFGWMITPDGSMFPLDQLKIKDKTEFNFQAGLKKFCLVAEDCGNNAIKLLNGHKLQKMMSLQLVKCKINDKEGFGLLRISQHNFEEHKVMRSVPQLLPSKFCMTPTKLVTNIESSHCCCVGAVGGKACSLALLNTLEAEFTVPRAICVTTRAYFNHLAEHSHIQTNIEELQNVLWKKKVGDAADLCTQIENTFLKTSLNIETSSLIKDEMRNVFKDEVGNLAFAVRSSAVDEDGDEMSLAGQNQTYLGVKGFDKICNAVIKCWASQFSNHATEYRRQNGCLINPGIGVVIQEMVPADSAGVIFTKNPVTENTGEIIINANYGLGEGIVSSTVEPDTFIIQRLNDTLNIKDKKVGGKQLSIYMDEDGCIKEMPKSEEDMNEYCLSDEIVLKLAELCILVEQSYGTARDIEWAIAGQQIFILQSRPITATQFTKFELMHEHDSSLKTNFEIYTKANTGEVFPGASSPLTISTIARSMDIGIQMSMTESHGTSFLANPLVSMSLVVSFNHVMLNCLDMLYRNINGKESSITSIIELAIFGSILHNDDMYKRAFERHGNKNHSHLKTNYYFLKEIFVSQKKLKMMSEMTENMNYSSNDRKCTTKEVLAEITSLCPFLIKLTRYHGSITAASMFWNLIAIQILVGKNAEWNETVYSDMACLLASCEDVVSADVPSALTELADIISTTADRKLISVELNAQEAAKWLNSQSGNKIGEKYQEFLQKHGHRCLREFDLVSPSWRMKPEDFVSVLQNMVKNHDSIRGQKVASSIKETIQQLKTSQSFLSKKILPWILPRYRAAVACREKSKSMLIKCVDCLRAAFWKLGDHLVNEGKLPDSKLIFFLTLYEIDQLVAARTPKLIKKAMARKKIHFTLDELKFPELIVGRPEPFQDDPISGGVLPTGTKLTGTPVCNGIVKGTARVIKHLNEANQIQANDILITYSTDIGWSPYFPLLSGIVTEIGGILSHGAVVAREFGLPSIIGVHNATVLFKSGDLVLLNGNTGIVCRRLRYRSGCRT